MVEGFVVCEDMNVVHVVHGVQTGMFLYCRIAYKNLNLFHVLN